MGHMAIPEPVSVARGLRHWPAGLGHVPISEAAVGANCGSKGINHVEWKRSSSLEFRAWCGLLGKQNRKQRLRCHFFVREGDPREQKGGKEEHGQEGWGPAPECTMALTTAW